MNQYLSQLYSTNTHSQNMRGGLNFLLNTCPRPAVSYILTFRLNVNVVSAIRGCSLLDTYRKYGHIHFFDEDFLKTYLKDYGFEIIAKAYGEEFIVQTSTLRSQIARPPRWILGRFSKEIASRIFGRYSFALLCVPLSRAVK